MRIPPWPGWLAAVVTALAGVAAVAPLAISGATAHSPVLAQFPFSSKQPLPANAPPDQVDPLILADGDRVYRLWVEERRRGLGGDIRFAQSHDGGDTWTAPITVDTDKESDARSNLVAAILDRGRLLLAYRTKTAAGDKFARFQISGEGGKPWLTQSPRLDYTAGVFEPSIAAGGQGGVYVAWPDEYSDPDPNGRRRVERRVFLARSADLGASWSRAVVLSTLGADATNPRRALFRPLLGAAGRVVYLTWLQTRTGTTDVLFRRSEDAGLTWSDAVALSESGANVYSDLQFAHDDSGSLYVLWAEDRQQDRTLVFRRSIDNGTSWDGPVRFGLGAGRRGAGQPVMAVGPTGLVVVAWSDSVNGRNDVYVTVSRDRGQRWQDPVRMDRDDPGTAVSQLPSIAVDRTGRIAVAWEDDRAGLPGVFLNASGDAGLNWLRTDLRVDAPAVNTQARRPRLAIDASGRIHVVWETHVDQRTHQMRQVQYRRVSWPAP